MAGGPFGQLRGALSLDNDALEEIADSKAALPVAILIVIGATLLAGLGVMWWLRMGGHPPARATYTRDTAGIFTRTVLVGGAIQVGMWVAWVAVTWVYLWAFGDQVSPWRLARTMGYAFAPIGLQLFIAPRGVELAAGALAMGYTIATTTAAVRVAARTTPGRALIANLAGFALFAIMLSLLGSGTRDLAPGIFALDPLPISVQYDARQ